MVDVGNVDLCKLWWYICDWIIKWMCYCYNDDMKLFYFNIEGVLYFRKNRYDMLMDVEIVFEI